jgi:hypothetical protein
MAVARIAVHVPDAVVVYLCEEGIVFGAADGAVCTLLVTRHALAALRPSDYPFNSTDGHINLPRNSPISPLRGRRWA